MVVAGPLAGCVAPEPVTRDGAVVAADRGPDATAPSPALHEGVLFKLLVAEFASHRGDLSLSLEAYMDVARETRDPGVAARAAKLALIAQENEVALEAARLWSEAAPESVEARQVLAPFLIRAGNSDEAADHLDMIVELSDPPGLGFRRVADLLSTVTDAEAAVALMKQLVVEHEDDGAAQLALARLLARYGRTEEASAAVERAYQLDPDHASAVILKARLRQRMGDVEGALGALEAFLERAPDSGRVRAAYARMLVDTTRYDHARAQFEHLVAEEPQNDDARYGLALLFVQTDQLDEAVQQLERLVRRGSRRDAAYYYLGRIADSRQQREDAITYYRRVRRGEHWINAQVRAAVLYAEQGDLDAARRHLRELRHESTQQQAVQIYRTEAGLLTRAERYDEAMAVFDESLETFPGNLELLYSRGMLAERMDRLNIVERDLREIIARDPDHAEALNALGYTLADRTDRYEEAYELIQRAIALKPDEAHIVDSMGWVLYRLGRYEEALAQLRRAMTLGFDPVIAAHLGEVLWVLGEKAEARDVWRTALEKAPDDELLREVIERFGP